MDHHFDDDGIAINQDAEVRPAPEKIELYSSVSGSLTETLADKLIQIFKAEMDLILNALENVHRQIDFKPECDTLVYKRIGRPGKHAAINYGTIMNAYCRICKKIFPTPFQARMFCCEAQKEILWPVCYTGNSETSLVCFPSVDYLVEYLGFMPAKSTLHYYCPFLGCKYISDGAPDCRHVQEQHVLMHSDDDRQPIICTIGNCGLYLKRPGEKLKEHRTSTHRHHVAVPGVLQELPAHTPVLLAALAPEKFYKAGLNYFMEEYEFRAKNPKFEPTPAPKALFSSRRSELEVEDQLPAPKARSSRKRSKVEREDMEQAPEPTLPASCTRSRVRMGEGKTPTSRLSSSLTLSDPELSNNSKDHVGEKEEEGSEQITVESVINASPPTDFIDYFENLAEILDDSSSSVTSTDESNDSWSEEDEANLRAGIRSCSLSCMDIHPDTI